jgi:diguanylate cyclase (GGDEF)-like protein
VVLREVAALLRSGCRRQDIVARYGGEEFCIGFVDTDLDDAVGLADRLRRDVSGHDWDRLLPDLRVTLSVGVATLAQGGDAGVLLASADAWLYAAKREGRDRVRWRDRTDAA